MSTLMVVRHTDVVMQALKGPMSTLIAVLGPSTGRTVLLSNQGADILKTANTNINPNYQLIVTMAQIRGTFSSSTKAYRNTLPGPSKAFPSWEVPKLVNNSVIRGTQLSLLSGLTQ